jgi:phosphoglycerate dehydrogenase-like enzyme
VWLKGNVPVAGTSVFGDSPGVAAAMERLLAAANNAVTQTQKQEDAIMKEKTTMQLGMIGLGRMGANMVRRLIKDGHRCVVFDRSPDAVKDLVKDKAVGATALADFVKKLDKPRAV